MVLEYAILKICQPTKLEDGEEKRKRRERDGALAVFVICISLRWRWGKKEEEEEGQVGREDRGRQRAEI